MIQRAKGSKTLRIKISSPLHFALNAAKKNKNAKSANSHYLFYDNDGVAIKDRYLSYGLGKTDGSRFSY